MINNTLSISEWTKKSDLLLKKVRNDFEKVGYQEKNLPTNVFDTEKPISVVFVGQYSAGKSTIIKALTGIQEIETGEGIKTMETHSYDWNGIEIVDTPGIHTDLRPDHDEISYKAIARADMLVYVVTEELFDNCLGHNFRKLLLDQDRASEMILVVNKMADIGNTEEKRLAKLKDLEKVTSPYSPTSLRTVFIDAESYVDSLCEEDADIAEELRNRSNQDQFVKTLNTFVAEKGISSRLTTALYKLYEALQEAIAKYQSTTGDIDVDATEEHLLRERHIISQAAWRIQSSVRAIYENAATEIQSLGRSTANGVFECEDEATAEGMLNDAFKEVEDISAECEKDVVARIEELDADCQAKLDEFYNSDFSSSLRFRLEKKKDEGNPIVNKILKSDWLTKGGEGLVKNTAGTNAAANGLKAFTGSNAHKWVLDIGHFFGHNFKPWEAVKWVKGINVAGKVLGVAGVFLSAGLQVKSDIDEEERISETRKSRAELRACFNEAADGLVIHYTNAMNNLINENYHSRIEEIDKEIEEIRKLRQNKSDSCKLLEEAQTECRMLIEDIHRRGVEA